jgi:hypothetical protein
MSFISSSYDEFPGIEIPAVSEEEHKLVQTLYDTVKGDKKMMIEDAVVKSGIPLPNSERPTGEWKIGGKTTH